MTLLQYSDNNNKMVLLLSTNSQTVENGYSEIVAQYNKSKLGVQVVDKICPSHNTAKVANR